MQRRRNEFANVLITGASRGIGLGLVQGILNKFPECRVIATCRSPDTASALSELGRTHTRERLLVLPLDTTQAASHQAVSERLASEGITSIDVVIANAGIASENHGGDLPLSSTPADMLNVYNTNVVGSLLTIQAYNSLLCAGTPRLLMVISSRLGSIEQTAGTGMMTSYRASKAAVNMLAMTYAEDKAFRAAGGKVLAVHPGWVQTDMGQSGGRKAPVTVADSVDGMLQLMQAASDVQTQGQASSTSAAPPRYTPFQDKLKRDNCVFVGYDGELLPW